MYNLRCRRCRCQLGVEDSLLTWHGEKLVGESKEICDFSDGAKEKINVWFIDLETSPYWIQNLVIKGKWMKGKLVCPKCQGRLGSFDFIKTLRCPCLQHKLPAIHILKARVDAQTKYDSDKSSDLRVMWLNSQSSGTKDLSQNQQGFFEIINMQDVGATNKTEEDSLRIRNLNLQPIGKIHDNHQPIRILEIQPIANMQEDSQPFRLHKTEPGSDIQKDNLLVRELEAISGSCFSTACATKDEDKEHIYLMDHELGWNSVLRGTNLVGQNKESSVPRGIDLVGQNQDSSFLRGINLIGENQESSVLKVINLVGRNQESNGINLSHNFSRSLEVNTVDICRNKNITSRCCQVQRNNSSIKKDTTQTANYLIQNGTVLYGDNSENQSISGSIEDIFLEQGLCQDLSSSTRIRKDRRRNRFTVLQDQTPSEVNSSSLAKEEEDTASVLVIPEENLCAVCLDLYFSPQRCYPCLHVFCEPCLRRLARNQPTNTMCPLCRVLIEQCIPDQDLVHKLRKQFAKAYRARKHEERKVQQEYYQLPQKGFHFFPYHRNRLLRSSPPCIPSMMFKIVFYFLLMYVLFVGVTAIIQWQIYPELTNKEFSGMSNSHLSPRTGRSTIIR